MLRSFIYSLFFLALFLNRPIEAAGAPAPINIKFSHVVAADTPKGRAAIRFKELAEKYTANKVKVEVYPNSQLYKDKEELEALQLGAIQMLAPSLSKFAPLGVKEFELFDFPFIFDEYADIHAITEGSVGKTLLAKLENKGIKGSAFWDNGFKSFSANTPITTPADLKGKKMRIQSSKVLEAQMIALGANPQVMAFSEVYNALQQGIIDGTENPISNFYTQKMHEVQKHLSISNHGYLGYALVVNKKFWDSLPSDIRNALNQAIKESTAYANKIAKEENDQALELVKRSGKTQVTALTPKERMVFKKLLLKVHQDMASRVGNDLLQEVYKATHFDPNQL